jgi:hypothetical protein
MRDSASRPAAYDEVQPAKTGPQAGNGALMGLQTSMLVIQT